MIKKYCIIAFVILCIVFSFFPKLDIIFVQNFYHEQLDFIYRDHPAAIASFKLVPIITVTWGAICGAYLVYALWKGKKILSSPAMYLLVAALLGPGLFVNYGLKEHSGRARPKHILEFGGDKAFTAPLIIADQCDHNCSFSSGHAAMGYYFSAISYVISAPYRNIAFIAGVALGSIIGFGRVLQGGHFLSDVLFSGLFIMITNHLCFLLWHKLTRSRAPRGQKRRRKLG